jgi:hypothetical protein
VGDWGSRTFTSPQCDIFGFSKFRFSLEPKLLIPPRGPAIFFARVRMPSSLGFAKARAVCFKSSVNSIIRRAVSASPTIGVNLRYLSALARTLATTFFRFMESLHPLASLLHGREFDGVTHIALAC